MIISILFILLVTLNCCISYRNKQLGPSIFLVVSLVLFYSSFVDLLPVFKSLIYFLLFCSIGWQLYLSKGFIFSRLNWTSLDTTLVFLVALGFWFARNIEIHSWDEFTHWGMLLKYIKVEQQIQSGPLPIAFPSYLPGHSLWLDFLTAPEDVVPAHWYGANFALMLLIPWVGLRTYWSERTLSNIEKSSHFLIIILLFSFLAYYTQNNIFSLYVDNLMTLSFFIGLLSVLVKDRKASLTLLFSQCVLLIITKHIGFVLALLLTANWIIVRLDFKLKNWKAPVLCILGSVVLKFSWDLRLSFLDIQKNFSEGGLQIFGFLSRTIAFSQTPFEQEITYKFIMSLYQNKLVRYEVALLSAVALIGLISNKKQTLRILVGSFVTSTAYLTLLLITYIYLFGGYEARVLASMYRYVHPILGGWILFLSIFILSEISPHIPFKRIFASAKILIAACLIFYILGLERKMGLGQPENLETALNLSAKIKSTLPINDPKKIFVIWQGSNGIEYWMLRYNLYPHTAQNEAVWTMGDKIYKGDMWTEDLSDLQAKELFSKFDYIFVAKSTPEFWVRYGHFFNDHKEGLFEKGRFGKVVFNFKDLK